MRVVDENHKWRLIKERFIQFATSLPCVVYERVPLAYIVFLANHALDKLCQKVDKLALLRLSVLRSLHEGNRRLNWLYLLSFTQLLGKCRASFLSHHVFVDARDFTQEVDFVQVVAADQYISKKVFLLQAHSLAEKDEQHLDDGLPCI